MPTKGGTTVPLLKQNNCSSTSVPGWGSEPRGGRTVGGVLYGPSKNIKSGGCGLTSATMALKLGIDNPNGFDEAA